jgi:hypothetical protein
MWPAIIAAAGSLMGQSGGGSSAAGGGGSAAGGSGGWGEMAGGLGGMSQGGSSPWWSPQTKMGNSLGGITQGIAAWFMDNPFKDGAEYYDKLPGMFEKEYRPWIDKGFGAADYYNDMGKQAGGDLKTQLNNLTNDPTGMMKKWGDTYNQSPGYQWQYDQAMQGANRAAAAGGMAGSPMHQQAAQTAATGLANQDYWNYMGNVRNLYGEGLNGLEGMYATGAQTANNMYSTGAHMANSLADNLGAAYLNQGQNAASQTNWDNQRLGGSIGSITQGLTSA